MLNMVNACQKRDCEFYSVFTETCDFTLINSRRRPCPIEGCTEYRERAERRPWMKFWPFAAKTGEGSMEVPERGLEPPEPRCVVAACGHDVYDGEYFYVWSDGETMCPDCLEDRFDALTTLEKASLCGCEASPVNFSEGRYGDAEEEI